MDERQRAWIRRHHSWLVVALVAVVYGGLLVFTGGLTHEIRNDEIHFWETTKDYFVQPFPPSAESLRNYPELITPLSYIFWGQIEWLTGAGFFGGRVANMLMSLAVVLLLAASRLHDRADGLVTAVGLLAYPYFLGLGFHLYTDMVSGFLVVFGLHFHLRAQPLLSLLFFALACAARQFVVQVPAALVAWEAWRWWRGEEGASLSRIAWPALACASLLPWIVFWGGLSPEPGIERWVPLYPAPMMSPFEFILDYGLYFVVCLGFYFAVVETLLFRELPARAHLAQPWVLAAAVALAVLFWIDPPLLSDDQVGGWFGRASRTLLTGDVGDGLRGVLYYGLALFGVLRLGSAGGLPLLVVAAGFAMSMKSQIPWEKYLFPCLVSLWYLRSRPNQTGGMRPAWEPEMRSADSRSPFRD